MRTDAMGTHKVEKWISSSTFMRVTMATRLGWAQSHSPTPSWLDDALALGIRCERGRTTQPTPMMEAPKTPTQDGPPSSLEYSQRQHMSSELGIAKKNQGTFNHLKCSHHNWNQKFRFGSDKKVFYFFCSIKRGLEWRRDEEEHTAIKMVQSDPEEGNINHLKWWNKDYSSLHKVKKFLRIVKSNNLNTCDLQVE